MARAKKQKDTSEEPKVEKLSKPKALSPFDIIKMMFTDANSYSKMTKVLLDKNSFMINRTFAINYPLQAMCFNKLTCNGADVVNAWCVFGRKLCGYGRVPSFVYTRSGKKTISNNEDVVLDKNLVNDYCVHFGLSQKDFNDLMEFDKAFVVDDVNKYNAITNDALKNSFSQEKIKKNKK